MRNSILIAAALLVLLAVSANSQPMNPGMMAEKLGLSDQQIEQLQSMKLQLQKSMVQMKADLKIARLEMKEIMMKSKVDDKAAMAKQEQILKIRAEIAKARLKHKLEVRKTFTDEQLKSAMKMRGEMRFGHGPRHKKCCGMGPCEGRGPMMPPMMQHERETEEEEHDK